MSESIVFAEFELKYNNFLIINAGEWDMITLLLHY